MTFKCIKQKLFKNWVDKSDLKNIFYRLRLKRYTKKNKFDPNYESNEEGYSLVFEDNFESQADSETKWNYKQHWGRIHPENPFHYTGIEGTAIRNNKLELFTKYAPKEVIHQGIKYYPDYVKGDLTCKQEFQKGIFEIRCKLPRNGKCNQAFWLWGKETWPPEIDIFEFFPDNENDKWKQQSITPHWLTGNPDCSPHGKEMSPMKYKLPLSITEEYHTYTLIWTDDKLEFKFDGLTIRKITNKKLVDSQSVTSKQFLVIGNSLHVEPEEVDENINPDTFYIDSVKVWQKV